MFIMTAIVLLCVLALFIVGILFWVPSLARDMFGPPAEDLPAEKQFLLSLSVLLRKDQLLYPSGNAPVAVSAVINEDETAAVIAERLQNQNLIPNAAAFLDYLSYKGYDSTIQQGEFELNFQMSPVDIAYEIQQPASKQVTIGMQPGWRVEEFIASLKTYGVVPDEDRILEIAKDPEAFGITSRLPIENGLEGFLLEGQYEFLREGLTDEDIIYAMLLNFEASLAPEWEKKFADHGLTLREAVILASIIQRETNVASEMPDIASVFYNRLANGMKLETDPTVQYAIGHDETSSSWWKSSLTLNDLQVDSPFNTYLYPGLPPAPICSPGLDALKAVANPSESSNFYFRAACDGSGTHVFSETFEEHLANACE